MIRLVVAVIVTAVCIAVVLVRPVTTSVKIINEHALNIDEVIEQNASLDHCEAKLNQVAIDIGIRIDVVQLRHPRDNLSSKLAKESAQFVPLAALAMKEKNMHRLMRQKKSPLIVRERAKELLVEIDVVAVSRASRDLTRPHKLG